jgi:murein DD-endopeptidase MepM/ murein hydrolase activator NlpD
MVLGLAFAATATLCGAEKPSPPLVLKDLPAAGPSAAPSPAALFDLFGSFAVESYQLQPGDTLTAVAKSRGVSVETILSYNRIQSPRYLRAGQTIGIPSANGILISLSEPTPVADIVRHYQVQPDWFASVNASRISGGMATGELFLPGVRASQDMLAGELGVILSWPTTGGRISSRYGPRKDPFTGVASNHKGLDIANYQGAPVFATANGRVIGTGRDEVLGNYIRVDMGKGVVTLYGHLSKILTRTGAKVVRGQCIGAVGSTGYSTGPHLHFNAYKNGRLVNPLKIFN